MSFNKKTSRNDSYEREKLKNEKNARPVQKEEEEKVQENSDKKKTIMPDKEVTVKKVDDKFKKKDVVEVNNKNNSKSKSRPENNGSVVDVEKRTENQTVKEQKISIKEVSRREPQEKIPAPPPNDRKLSSSRTPSPFLKPHERKDFVSTQKENKEKIQELSSETDDDAGEELQARKITKMPNKLNVSDDKRDVSKLSRKIDARKDDGKTVKTAKSKMIESELKTRPAKSNKNDNHNNDEDNNSNNESERSKKRKKKYQDASSSDESEVEKKKKRSKKHKKHSKKKSKKKSVSEEKSSDSKSEEETNVNESLEKKLREKALVSLMRKNKKSE